jgi:hydrogenase-4 component B
MALSSYFLVTLENEKESVQRAGWTYLVATHLGTIALFFFFILLGAKAGSLDFDRFAAISSLKGPEASLFFVLALVGFGTKAGIIPLHVWLPEAHPAAPSHVSAVMSGVMIKTGIYGILRTLIWLESPPVGWAIALIIIGCVSGVFGVLLALAQHDLKRLLAYHSVENIGIIFLGMGIGVLGQATNLPALTILGYGGALLHTLNHAIFKGLLFLGAGSVQHGSHTLDIEKTGGLLRRMPWTGIAFLIGAIAICGLPPLNGFISEFLIYLGAFQGVQALGSWETIPAAVVIIALALIGGLAVACFTKAFGIVFLGEPRSVQTEQAHESKAAMRWPMVILAALCVIIGVSAPLILSLIEPVLQPFVGNYTAEFPQIVNSTQIPLTMIVYVALTIITLFFALAWFRRSLLSHRTKVKGVTWDCAYALPTARMQYTASSYAQPFMHLAGGILRLQNHLRKPEGYFPSEGEFSSHVPDISEQSIWKPSFKGMEWLLLRFRWMQTGSIHLYILYIAISLIALLIWKLH